MMERLAQYVVLLFLSFFCLSANGYGQSEQTQQVDEVESRSFDREHWQATIKDIDYSGEQLDEQKKKKKSDAEKGRGGTLPPESSGPSSYISSPLAGTILKVLVICGLVVVVFFILRSFLGLGLPFNRKVKSKVADIDLDALEDNLHESDFERFIQQALAQKDFALAVRLYYLHLLKGLSERSLIKWKKEKTNRDYLLELGNSPLADSFSQITLIFDRVRYGGDHLQEADYHRIAPQFAAFDQQIATRPR
ncbi:MAG: DUF4129 domain-containing protein [Bacteroidota bacterium]